MKTRTKLILPILATATLLFSVNSFADDDEYEYRGYKHGYEKHHGYKHKDRDCDDRDGKYHRGSKSRFIIGAVYSLDLTKDQKEKIDKALDEFQDNRKETLDAFKKDGFDKQAFIDARMNRKETMIKQRADLIEKIYSYLTKEQKAELKEKLEKQRYMR